MLRGERKYAPSSMSQTIVALRTFFRDHLGHDWALCKTVRVRQRESLPWALSRKEVAAVFGAAKLMRFRVLFTLIYHCGLRLGEAIRIAPGDIEAKELRIRIRHGKGGKERYVPVSAGMEGQLSVRMRTRFERALRERNPALFHQIAPSVWRKQWVVHSEPVGRGEHALKYLSRYIYRTAMSSERHLEESNGHVTFRYKDSKTREQKTARLPVLPFIARFLQHVLPKRFRRVRSYGWQSPAATKKFARIRALLDALPVSAPATPPKQPVVIFCPKCQKPMRLLGTFGRGPPR